VIVVSMVWVWVSFGVRIPTRAQTSVGWSLPFLRRGPLVVGALAPLICSLHATITSQVTSFVAIIAFDWGSTRLVGVIIIIVVIVVTAIMVAIIVACCHVVKFGSECVDLGVEIG